MEFKKSLGVPKADWLDIGIILGHTTDRAMKRKNISVCDLTNHIRGFNNIHIEPAYVTDYIKGEASFGCFYPIVEKFLEITPEEIFVKGEIENLQRDKEELHRYLTSVDTLDSFLSLLKVKPGKEMREHVAQVLRNYREERVAKSPYISIDIGLSAEEETNHYMQKHRDLLSFLRALNLDLNNSPLTLLSDSKLEQITNEENTRALVKPDVPKLYDILTKAIEKFYKEDGSRKKELLSGSKIVVQDALLRGRKGFTLDVFYPEEHIDRLISGEDEKAEDGYCKDWNIGLENWKRAYQKGDLSWIKDMQALSNLGISVDEFLPVRQPTPAERYEIHQRWAHQGGGFIPGPRLEPPPKDYYDKESTVKRSKFEDDAYVINSHLTIMLKLYDHLKDLVKDDFEV